MPLCGAGTVLHYAGQGVPKMPASLQTHACPEAQPLVSAVRQLQPVQQLPNDPIKHLLSCVPLQLTTVPQRWLSLTQCELA